uniref:Cnidarian restricted protein n=1 Tax=Clytia hemisphaerica TaxID=252671 RepID=A0A7M5UL06_9CNID
MLLLEILVFSTSLIQSACSNEILGIPENNHGQEAVTFVGEQEIALPRHFRLGVIPVLSPEWIFRFSIRFHSLDYVGDGSFSYCTVLHLTKGGNNDVYGDRTPSITIGGNPTLNEMKISAPVNGNKSYRQNIPFTLAVNETMDVEIHQRYISNGKYRYFIRINEEEIHSVVNTEAKQFYNVKVFAGQAFYAKQAVCPASIKNVKHYNFL